MHDQIRPLDVLERKLFGKLTEKAIDPTEKGGEVVPKNEAIFC